MLSSTDDRIIDAVVELWLSNGADAEGFSWCMSEILRRLREAEGKEE